MPEPMYADTSDPNAMSAGRDANSDSGGPGDSSHYIGRAPLQRMAFDAMTLQEEADNEGWTRITRPVGGPPADATTAGTRGANDEAVGDKDSPSRGVELPSQGPDRIH